MKKFYLAFLVMTCFCVGIISCNMNQSASSEMIISEYFSGYNMRNFDMISTYVSDSILISEMDHVVSSDRQELYTHFQWDSVFIPKYKIIDLVSNEDTVFVTASKICKRIKYLHDKPTVYKANFIIDHQQIVKVQTTEFLEFDYKIWEARRDSLVAWIDDNHNALSGFQYDLTLQGAHNYLEAIDLYNRHKAANSQ